MKPNARCRVHPAPLLAGITGAALVAAWLIGPVVQDPAYHRFADTRPCGPVPNCLDVLTNLAFLAVAVPGLRRLADWPPRLRPAMAAFWWGVLLVTAGSAWYHWSPDDARLVWDRLPMTVAFMGLFAAVLIDRLHCPPRVLAFLLVLGPVSVGVWVWSADLRFYGLVQFLPMVLIAVVLVWRPAGRVSRGALLWALGWYAAAKGAEWFDREVFAWTGVISGHSFKHLLAALATVRLWRPAIPPSR